MEESFASSPELSNFLDEFKDMGFVPSVSFRNSTGFVSPPISPHPEEVTIHSPMLKKRETFEDRVNTMACRKKVYSQGRKSVRSIPYISSRVIEDNVDDVKEVLNQIFNEVTPDLGSHLLSIRQQNAIRQILKGKMELSENLTVQKIRKPRRAEEEYKFIVKKALKFLFRQFKRRNSDFIRGQKVLDELELYNYYFKDVLDVEEALMPGCKLQKASMRSNLNKTVSGSYLEKILTSSQFRKDFREYLEKHFMREYESIRETKIENIAKSVCEDNLKRVQLPWTISEVEQARMNLLNILDRF